MQFQVPQFIDVEDKIFGPLTFKQFIYILGGGGAIFVVYKILGSLYLSLIVGAPIAGLALALAFYKVNDRPFVFMLESAVKFYLTSKLFLWKKTVANKPTPASANGKENVIGLSSFSPKMTGDKLKDLAWSLDVHEKIAKK